MSEFVEKLKQQSARTDITLRPGVAFPDWSAIVSPVAGEALTAMIDAFGVEKRWRGYGGEEDGVHVALLQRYAIQGRAPTPVELTTTTGLAVDEITSIVARLAKRDMVVLDPADGSITGAYPFTERETGHRVTIGDRVLNAMCAVDALGAGAMYGIDATTRSTCLHCGTAIRIATASRGTTLADASPDEAVVLAGIAYQDNAASSLCTIIAFFCCDEHLEIWRAKNRPGAPDYRLSLDEALQVGRAIFGPFLANVGEDQIRMWG